MKAVDDIISTLMKKSFLDRNWHCGQNPKGFKIKPFGMRLVLILVILLVLTGCSLAASSSGSSTQAISASATVDPANARATTLARQIPASLVSEDPQSAVEITPNPQTLTEEALEGTLAPASLPSATPTPTHTRLPFQTSDLLYLATSSIGKSALMRWDSFTGYSGLLADNVELFQASADGKKILLLRPHDISANGQALYDLALLNYETLQTAPLLEQIPYPYWLAISPDGNWFAYQERAEGGMIYARSSDTPSQSVELGECNSGNSDLLCSQIAWSPDSRQVVWSDSNGLWISSPLQPEAQLIHKPVVDVSDPKGNITEVPVTLHNITWSPVGRFIKVQVMPSLEGVRWQSVIDTRLGRLKDIPESSEYTALSVSVHWTKAGGLVVAHGSNGSAPFVKTWDVLVANTELVELRRKYEINLDQLIGALPTATSETPTEAPQPAHLTWFSEYDETTLFFGMIFTAPTSPDRSKNAPILFSLNLSAGGSRKLIDLPNDASEVYWTPDGSGALILSEQGQFLFFSLRNNTLSDVGSGIGAGAHGFVWLPPRMRR